MGANNTSICEAEAGTRILLMEGFDPNYTPEVVVVRQGNKALFLKGGPKQLNESLGTGVQIVESIDAMELVERQAGGHTVKTVKDGRWIVEGPYQRSDVKNANGRTYPRKLWERLIADEKSPVQECVAARGMTGHLEHPADGRTNIKENAMVTTKLDLLDDGVVWGRSEILDTPNGLILQEHCIKKVRWGVSSRGSGSVSADGKVSESDFGLTTFDAVSAPSTPGAYPQPVANEDENAPVLESAPDGDEATVNEAESFYTRHTTVTPRFGGRKKNSEDRYYTHHGIYSVEHKQNGKHGLWYVPTQGPGGAPAALKMTHLKDHASHQEALAAAKAHHETKPPLRSSNGGVPRPWMGESADLGPEARRIIAECNLLRDLPITEGADQTALTKTIMGNMAQVDALQASGKLPPSMAYDLTDWLAKKLRETSGGTSEGNSNPEHDEYFHDKVAMLSHALHGEAQIIMDRFARVQCYEVFEPGVRPNPSAKNHIAKIFKDKIMANAVRFGDRAPAQLPGKYELHNPTVGEATVYIKELLTAWKERKNKTESLDEALTMKKEFDLLLVCDHKPDTKELSGAVRSVLLNKGAKLKTLECKPGSQVKDGQQYYDCRMVAAFEHDDEGNAARVKAIAELIGKFPGVRVQATHTTHEATDESEPVFYKTFKRSATSFGEFSSARKITVDTGLTLKQAQDACKAYNDALSARQKAKGTKMEFTRMEESDFEGQVTDTIDETVGQASDGARRSAMFRRVVATLESKLATANETIASLQNQLLEQSCEKDTRLSRVVEQRDRALAVARSLRQTIDEAESQLTAATEALADMSVTEVESTVAEDIDALLKEHPDLSKFQLVLSKATNATELQEIVAMLGHGAPPVVESTASGVSPPRPRMLPPVGAALASQADTEPSRASSAHPHAKMVMEGLARMGGTRAPTP